MQQLVFVAAGRIEFQEHAAPTLGGEGEALVRPLAVARCDLDTVIARGLAPIAGPFPLGHECVGDVVQIGAGVRSVRVGDRVIVPFQISCGACSRCVSGKTGSCTAVPKGSAYGLGPFGGGDAYGGAIADVVRVPFADAMLVSLARDLDPVAAAALGDNAIDGFRTVAGPLANEPHARVLVAGGGAASVGLYAVAAARALGAAEVVYVDPSEKRAEIAARLGAKTVLDKWSPSLRVGLFPITVDATADQAGLRFVLASTDAGGTCTSVGIYFADVALPLLQMYQRGIRFITGRVDARRDLPAAAALFAAGKLDLGSVATTVVPWADAAKAWTESTPKLVLRRDNLQ